MSNPIFRGCDWSNSPHVSRQLSQNLVGECQIPRKSLELELQSAGNAASSPTFNRILHASPIGDAYNILKRSGTNAFDAVDESQRNTLFEAELDEEDELFAAEVWQQMVALVDAELEDEKKHGDSRRGRAPNVDRLFTETHTRFLSSTFGVRPHSP
jgi:hypothetical protein